MGKLSHKLLDLGFFSALGTTEKDGINRQTVGRRTPLTMDKNQGTLVIYDEKGFPWIKRTADVDLEEIRKLTQEFPIKVGAYVPHSNDGGYFIRVVVASLTGAKVSPEDIRDTEGFQQLTDDVMRGMNRV
jgi:hypothetical protein